MSTAGLGAEAVYDEAVEAEEAPMMTADEPAPRAEKSIVSRPSRDPLIDPHDVARRRLDRTARRSRRAIDKCFDAGKKRGLAGAELTLYVELGSDGHVLHVSFDTDGTDTQLRDCLEKEVRSWLVRHRGDSSVTVDLTLSRSR
jgi:hypothetical protein